MAECDNCQAAVDRVYPCPCGRPDSTLRLCATCLASVETVEVEA